MSNKIEFNNPLSVLGIDNKSISTLKDEDIEKYYINKLIEIYIDVVKLYPHSMDITNFNENESRTALLNLIETKTQNVNSQKVIQILENIIRDYGKSNVEKSNINLILDLARQSYDSISTFDARKNYLTDNKKSLDTYSNLCDLINHIYASNNSSHFPLELKTVYNKKLQDCMVKNVTIVENLDHPKYNVDYSDEYITILFLDELEFTNVNKKDILNEYLLVIRDNNRKILFHVPFYGNLDFSKLNNSEYVSALGLAIEENSKGKKSIPYIGELEKYGQLFYCFKDHSHELAIEQYEKMEKEKYKALIKNDESR